MRVSSIEGDCCCIVNMFGTENSAQLREFVVYYMNVTIQLTAIVSGSDHAARAGKCHNAQ